MCALCGLDGKRKCVCGLDGKCACGLDSKCGWMRLDIWDRLPEFKLRWGMYVGKIRLMGQTTLA